MSMHLIEFRGMPRRRSGPGDKHVTLDRKGVLYMSARVVQMLGEPEAVTLHYDPHKQIIGLTPASRSRANAFRLKPKEQTNNRLIHARLFCKHFDIKILRTVAFNTAEIDPETGRLLLDLTDTTFIGREPGSRNGNR